MAFEGGACLGRQLASGLCLPGADAQFHPRGRRAQHHPVGLLAAHQGAGNLGGTPLIDRSTYPIKLSDAGQDFLPVAKDVTLTLLRNRDDLRARDRGGLRFHGFAAPHSVSITHLAPHLKALEEADPALRTRVVSDNLNTCCQLLSDGDCEFLMCYRHPHIPLTLDEQEFARIDLGPERLVPVVIPDETGAPAWALPGRRSRPDPASGLCQGIVPAGGGRPHARRQDGGPRSPPHGRLRRGA